ncbi:pilus assembly protein [Rhodanobacter aciditrophus]|uniref:pilus assembly protein n=1 Tax=Rhodanobacter aciditrophus TaxID=1623218 RepID=UPI003CE85CB9
MTRHRHLLEHARAFTPALLLTLAGGIGATIPVQAVPSPPSVSALATTATTSSTSPATASTAALAGEVQLSATPPNQTQSVPPNVAVTFDDSGSMAWDYMGDTTPFKNSSWSGGPWYCAAVIDPGATSGIGAHVMNGVYYNPNVTYTPPVNADGTSFPNADATLKAVWNDGIAWNRPLGPSTGAGTTDFTNQTSSSRWGGTTTTYWACPYDSGRNYNLGTSGNRYTSTNHSGGTGGPYYYEYTGTAVAVDSFGKPTSTGLTNLYTASNWTAVPVPSDQYQNWANWWAYYRTRNQMARTALSRVFGSSNLASKINDPGMWDDGSFGSTIRVAWQNLYNGYAGIYDQFVLQSSTLISSLLDTTPDTCKSSQPTLGSQSLQSGTVKTPPSCYRSDFFNWIFQVPAVSGTPTRSATARAGQFFTRGYGNTGSSGDLHDPYWQPPQTGSGDGHELACRQNYHMLITDGLWNGGTDGPAYSTLTLPASGLKLPDKVVMPDPTTAGVTSIYNPVHDAGDTGYASLSDIAFHYWATNLRSDLYKPASGDIVSPYLPDQTVNVFNLAGKTSSVVDATAINPEVYFNPKNDPATWPHMADYMIGLGVSGNLNFSEDTDCVAGSSDNSDACLLRQGTANSSGAAGWPTPNGSGNGIAANIDDTWHAALAGRGQFFSASNPKQLVDQLSKILTNISARNVPPATTALNTSVLVPGALAFTTGYNAADWSGTLQAVQANADGTVGNTPLWDAGTLLTDTKVTDPTKRNILTAKENTDGSFGGGISFESSTTFDAAAQTALMLPAPTDTTNDTLANRINYLRGDRTEETKDVMRKRTSLLGAIVDSHAVYVAYPASGYLDSWPAGSPEAAAAASGATTDDGTYEQFVQNHIDRKPVVYVGANDGMLHAFDASEQQNTATPPQIVPTSGAGQEVFAYVPRSVYGNLGNLTSTSFSFLPTVDGTPVTRDVFFDAATSSPATTTAGWHTILVGNLRNGGRGVYALDVTDPTKVTEATASSKVLWEFSADQTTATSGCYSNYGTCNPADLGFTYGEPNIGRLANGKWVVLVPGGYFPDCSKAPYLGSSCPTPAGAPTAGSPAVAFSSLFVLDAQTGAMLAELKTPTNLTGVTSYGLGSPVLGDYNNDQIDDIAFAGDLAGNLWRYDLTSSSSSGWTVSLAYQPATEGAQPITVMPRLFPDPATNRFIVVFGTGKYLGTNDNTSAGVPTQAIYGIRDLLDSSGNPVTVSGTSNLEQQTLAEASVTNGGITNTLRGVTDNAVSATQDGWYINLDLTSSPGERVVVTPGALFDTNRVVVTTLIPASNDPCTATITGATMVLDAATGGSGGGLSTPSYSSWTGSSPYRMVGGLVNNPPTSGTVPVATVVGGGSLLTPGLPLAGGGSLKIDDAVWRRRSWGALDNDQ